MDGWTEVRYGRRRQQNRQQQQSWDRGFRGSWGTERAPPFRSRRGFSPFPNRPVPPSRATWFSGNQYRSYADVVRQGRFQPTRRWFPPGNRDAGIPRQAADPQFGRLIRKIYAVVKTVHHLQNVAPKPGKAEPRMITRMVETLSRMVKPAAPSQRTTDLIMGNAMNWGHSTCLILQDHYERCMDDFLEDLIRLLTPGWKEAFDVAVRWARRNLPRITQEAIDDAEALVAARVGYKRPTPAAQPQRLEATTQDQPQTQSREQDGRPRDRVRIRDPEGRSQDQEQNQDRVQVRPSQDQDRRSQPRDQEQGRGRDSERQPAAVVEDIIGAEEVDLQPADQDWHRSPPPSTAGDDSPLPPRVQRLTHRTRGDVPPEDSIEEDPEPTKRGERGTPIPHSPTHSDLEAMFDQLYEEEEAERNRTSTPRENLVRTVADVHRESEEDEEFVDSPDHFVQREPKRYKVFRHPTTQRKLTEWSFVARKKILIIGDSNLSQFPDFFNPNLQVECFPGSHFRHAQALMEKMDPPLDLVVEKIVLSFGINSRINKCKETTIKNVQAALRSTKKRFPYADIWIPLVNFSAALPQDEQENLQTLNDHLERNMPFIPLLPEDRFETEADDIHWTRDTAEAMFDHWKDFLNAKTP